MKVKTQIAIIILALFAISITSCKKATDGTPVGDEKEIGAKVGLYAPDFTLPDKDGNSKTLYHYKGKMVLIDFWASWCHICRGENPKLVALYAEYKAKGFEILGVSIDTDRSSWLDAVQDDGIAYIQVCDLKGMDSPVVNAYGVAGVPRMLLTDEEGKILLITNKASEVAAVVEEKLK